MPTLKTEDRQFTSNSSQHPSSSRRKRSSQPSFELSSSKECLVAEKGREKERKWEKGGSSDETTSHRLFQREVLIVTNLDSSLYTAQSEGNYKKKKKTETKSYYKDKMGKNQTL